MTLCLDLSPVVHQKAGLASYTRELATQRVRLDAGIAWSAFHVRALAVAVERALTNEALRASLRARGLERARRFTWEKAARRTLEVYRQVSESI